MSVGGRRICQIDDAFGGGERPQQVEAAAGEMSTWQETQEFFSPIDTPSTTPMSHYAEI